MTRGRRLPAAGKVARDREIVIDRNRGLSWPVIAQRHGLQERQCRAIYAQWRDSEKDPIRGIDPVEWLRETEGRWAARHGAGAARVCFVPPTVGKPERVQRRRSPSRQMPP